MNGLLGMGQQSAPMGGLLGGGMPQGMPAAPQDGAQNNEMEMAKQMVNALMQNPTPQTVSMIIDELKKTPTQESQQIIQVLQENANDPEGLTELAQQIGAQLK